MILGTALLLLCGAAALPRGSGGMQGHFLREKYADGAQSPQQSPPSVQRVFPSEPSPSPLERGRRDDAVIPPQTSFLRPSQIQPPAVALRRPSDDLASLHWGRREEANSEDFQTSRQPFYPILSYSTKREDSGAYSYRFETADGHSKEETSDIDLERSSGSDDPTNPANNDNRKRVVRGWYSYPSPNGESLIRVDYVADENGFRATQTEQVRVNPSVGRPSQRLFGAQTKPSRDDARDETSESAQELEDQQTYSTSPSIYYRQLGQGGFFYSYRAPSSLQ